MFDRGGDPFYVEHGVLITGRAAARLGPPLRRLLAREARDNGVHIDAEILAIANAIERAGRIYLSARGVGQTPDSTTSDSGTRLRPVREAVSPSDVHGWLPTSAVADRLRCTPRNVRRLIAEGQLVGIRVGRNHLVDPAELARFLGDREHTG